MYPLRSGIDAPSAYLGPAAPGWQSRSTAAGSGGLDPQPLHLRRALARAGAVGGHAHRGDQQRGRLGPEERRHLVVVERDAAGAVAERVGGELEAAHGGTGFEQSRPVAAGAGPLDDVAERGAVHGVEGAVAAERLIEAEVGHVLAVRPPLDLLEVSSPPAVGARGDTVDRVDREEVLEQRVPLPDEVCG